VKAAPSNPTLPAGALGPPLIEAVDLAIGSGGASESRVVEGIEWAIRAGDCWVVGGLAGSGKSELLATLAGLYRPAGGTLRLFGREVNDIDDDALLAVRLRVGLVFEHGGRLFNHLTVSENLAVPLRYHTDLGEREITERIEPALEMADALEWRHMSPGRLNPARRQRVALARALVLRPDVLLLDNPLAGAGPPEARWWRDCLSRFSSGSTLTEGVPSTLVLTCHDLGPWTDQGRQFALLKQGRWSTVGGREALAGCGEPLVRELMAGDFATR
jgi:ABC-type transporter Mla maintaining outer membrane lipid asymmetry ATPase subunit MlaF